MRTRILSMVAAAGLLAGTTTICVAQNSAQDKAPGQRMQDKGSMPGHPGASGYAPGHEMQQKGSKPGEPGASGYAPGHDSTSGQGSRSGTGTGSKSNSR
jgi:hypothetical protein